MALASAGAFAQTVKIGWLSSLTCPLSSAAIAENQGVQLAVEEINKAGGILGKQIELLTRDTANFAQQLAFSDKVQFVIGPVNSGGEFVVMLGRNGAGKSTLLHAMSGLVPKRAGSIHIQSPAGRGRSARRADLLPEPAARLPRQPAAVALAQTGAVLEGRDEKLLQWITDSGLAVLIADNYAVEAHPATRQMGCCATLPLHEHCLFKLGDRLTSV